MFKIYSHTKIYIPCPARGVSGGPEAIHQLTDKLRKFGHEAYIVYLPTVENPSPAEYQSYDIDYIAADRIEDRVENVLIVPEVWPYMLRHCSHIQKGIWWLSAHNFPQETEKQFQLTGPKTEKSFTWPSHGMPNYFYLTRAQRMFIP